MGQLSALDLGLGGSPLCCPGCKKPTLPSAAASEGQGQLICSQDPRASSPRLPKVVRGEVRRASPPHPLYLTADEWQGQLSQAHILRTGSPAVPPLPHPPMEPGPALLCFLHNVAGLSPESAVKGQGQLSQDSQEIGRVGSKQPSDINMAPGGSSSDQRLLHGLWW